MRHYTILSAIALVAFLTLAGPSTARQLGPDAQPNLYTGKQLIDDGSCATSLAKHLWGSADGKSTPYDPTRDAFPDGGAAMQTAVVVGCEGQTAKHSDLPFLIHGSLWRARAAQSGKASFYLAKSEWEVYSPRHAKNEQESADRKHVLLEHGYRRGAGGRIESSILETRPPLYGARQIRFLGVSCFLSAVGTPMDPSQMADFQIQYKIGTTVVTPENVSNFNAVVNALFGKAASVAPPAPPPPLPGETKVIRPSYLPCRVTFAPVDSQALPVSINITIYGGGKDQGDASATGSPAEESPAQDVPSGPSESDGPPAAGSPIATAVGAQTNVASTDCTAASAAKGCTLMHSPIPVPAREAWDLGLGVAVPGVREPQYAASNPAILQQPTRHTDLYGFANIFPFARWASKSSLAPSLVVGIPVTGKVFYRPFFGIGESLNGISALKKILPMQINFVAGVVLLNQEVVDGNGMGGLRIDHSRAVKKMAGIEVPVGALVSKITSIGGKGNSTNSNGGSSPKGN